MVSRCFASVLMAHISAPWMPSSTQRLIVFEPPPPHPTIRMLTLRVSANFAKLGVVGARVGGRGRLLLLDQGLVLLVLRDRFLDDGLHRWFLAPVCQTSVIRSEEALLEIRT